MEWIFGKKKNKKEVKDMTRDEEEIKKAREDIDRKGKDSQTEKDRIDESVGEQERHSGNENSQNAKDRVDESEGTKKYDEKRAEERRDEGRKDDAGNRRDELMDKLLDAMERIISAMGRREENTSEKAERAAEKYGLPSAGAGEAKKRSFTDEDVKKLLG